MLSVVIPLHNLGYKGDYCLKRCLDSILAQTYNDYEVLLMENGSTDDTIKIAEEYCKKDNRFKLHILDTIGVSNARNKGIELAKGEYITFIDGDDFISSDYFTSAFHTIQTNAVDITILNCVLYYNSKKLKQTTHYEDKFFNNDTKFSFEFIGTVWNNIFRIDFIKSNNLLFDNQLTHGEDVLFTYESLFLADTIATVKTGMYYYVQNRKGQATKLAKGVLKAEIIPIIKFKNLIEKYKLNNLYDSQIIDKFISLFVGGGSFAQTRVTKMSLYNLYKELKKYQGEILSFKIDDKYDFIKPWKLMWYNKFIKIYKNNIFFAALFLKLMRVYRNILIKPFNIKWYE